MEERKTARDAGLDALKTLAMFGVIFYHSFTAGIDVVAGGAAARAHYFVYSACCMSVPLFFMVNGYLLFAKPFHLRRHVIRLVKLAALSVLWQAATLLLLMPVKGETLGIGDWLRGVLYGKAGWTDHFWFLGALGMTYVFFPAAKAAFDHARGSFLFFTAVTALFTFGNTALNMLACTASFVLRGTGREAENLFSTFNAYAGVYGFALGYFLLGGALYAARERLARIPVWFCAPVLALCIAGQGAYGLMQSAWRGVTWDSVFFGYDTVFALLGTLSIFCLSRRFQGRGRIGAFCAFSGALTLPVYLVQGLMIPALRPAVKAWDISGSLGFALVFAALIFAASVALAWGMKRTPGLRAALRF